jgi:hypothetical protein
MELDRPKHGSGTKKNPVALIVSQRYPQGIMDCSDDDSQRSLDLIWEPCIIVLMEVVSWDSMIRVDFLRISVLRVTTVLRTEWKPDHFYFPTQERRQQQHQQLQ